MLKLPEEYTIGEAIDNGGCFFDSFAQLLNTYNNTEEYTEKSLRLACCDYVSKNSSAAISLINADKNSNISFANYDEEMSKTGEEIEVPQWGRTDVEGIMLCRQLGLDKFYVYEIGKDLGGAEFYSLCQVTKEKVININFSDSDLNKPTLIVKDLHFVPILPYNKINNKNNRLRAFNRDKNEGVNKTPSINTIQNTFPITNIYDDKKKQTKKGYKSTVSVKPELLVDMPQKTQEKLHMILNDTSSSLHNTITVKDILKIIEGLKGQQINVRGSHVTVKIDHHSFVIVSHGNINKKLSGTYICSFRLNLKKADVLIPQEASPMAIALKY